MKLMHPLFSKPIVFRENRISVLTVENTALFRQLVFELYDQAEGREGRFVLSEEDVVLDCAHCLKVIQDYAHIHAPDKRLQSKLLSALVQEAEESFPEENVRLHQQVQSYLETLAALAEYPVEYDTGENIMEILKAMNFRVELENLEPTEALVEHIGLYQRLLKHQCFVLVQAKSYFTREEMQQIYTMAQYQKWNLLLLESGTSRGVIEGEEHRVIDEDLCELSLENA